MTKKSIGFILIITIVFFLLLLRKEVYIIENISTPQEIILHSNNTLSETESLSIVGYGLINGSAKLTLLLNGESYKSEELSGRVSFKWYGDWYSESARLFYEPKKGTTGKLKLDYKFHTLL